MFDRAPIHPRGSLRDWMAGLTPAQQLAYGCLGVVIVGTLALYCAGTLSLLVRPILFQLPPPTPTALIVTAIPTQTPLPVLIPLPSGPVPNTPTQGPIPTREPATVTPTLDPLLTPGANMTAAIGTPRGSITATLKASATPTRR